MIPNLLPARQTLVLRYLVGCWGYDRHELQETRQRGEFIIIGINQSTSNIFELVKEELLKQDISHWLLKNNI